MDDRFRLRVTRCNSVEPSRKGAYVLYWMNAFRRPAWNLALERAVYWSRQLKKPLVVLEALRCDYPWACDRFHRFIIDGMNYNSEAFKGRVFYFPYIERSKGEGKGLLEALAALSAIVVTDDYPCFFLPRMVSAASKRLGVLMEKVDSNGLFPMRAANKVFLTAYSFRRLLQKELPGYLRALPIANPLEGIVVPPLEPPERILSIWPPADLEKLEDKPFPLGELPIDHNVKPAQQTGGTGEARRILHDFIESRLPRYVEDRSDPVKDATSRLSAYLHFGHISSAEVFQAVAEAEEWFFDRLSGRSSGGKSGWWGMSDSAEAFLDQLITWRELGFNMCHHVPHYDRYESLPQWARDTLMAHAGDPREYLYSGGVLEVAGTYDELWNAAQLQLVREGRIHNYLRMLWGKKILEWCQDPKVALSFMIELNNKYALDGRDPNSYSGIFWTMGRYDRPWGPERPVFGRIRYMSSANTARKFPVRLYINRYQGALGGEALGMNKKRGRKGNS